MESIQREWLARMEAEYHSAAAVAHYTLWLIQAGASPDLIKEGLKITDDEIVHAEFSHQVYLEAGGSGMPQLKQEELGLSRLSDNIYEDLLRIGVRFFCLGETVAVPLFQRMRKACTQEAARKALDRILSDEVRHRDFGWTLLDWLVEVSPEHKSAVQEILPDMFKELKEGYGAFPESSKISEEERAWGLISRSEYAEIFDRCLVRDYRPRFARCGITI